MNILFTVFSLNLGGIERLLIDIVKNWKEKEDTIHVCVINNDYNSNLIDELKKIDYVNLKLINRQPGGKRVTYLNEYIKYIIKHKIDVIHCQSMSALKFSIILKFIKPKIKIVHTVHATNMYVNYSNIDIFLDKVFTNNLIAISNSVKNEILSRNIPCKKVNLIYNGIDFSKFKFKTKKINREKINIGCVARLDYKVKGQDVLINAVGEIKNKYPNIRCYIAGGATHDNDKNLNYLKHLVDGLGLNDNIYFLGNVDNVKQFLEGIDIFILPSRHEGFGIALIEAMACGIPVIASNVDGPKEIIDENKYGYLFKNGDCMDLAIQIEKLISENDTNKLKDSYDNARNRYDINIMVEKLRYVFYK